MRTGSGPKLSVIVPPGEYDVEVVVTDPVGNKLVRHCHRRVLVTLPQITDCTIATDSLWPPNHALVNVWLGYNVVRGTYAIASTTVIVYSNEGDLGPDGDNNFSPDARNVSAGALRLRSERPGHSDGRVYLVVITTTDIKGNKATCSHMTVTVPHDQSRASRDLIAGKAAAAAAFAEANHGTPPSGYIKVGDGPIVGPEQ